MANISPAQQWCTVHAGWVDEGRTIPTGIGDGSRICAGCFDERELGSRLATSGLSNLLEAITDSALSTEDRAALYAVLYTAQLRINRVLRPVRDEVAAHMAASELRELGPLRIRWVAVEVAWPCNDSGNWSDAGVQDAMHALAGDPDTSAYIRTVPEHLEIDTRALGTDVAMGVTEARRLHRELNFRGWRTEGHRRATLEVRQQ